MNAQFSLFGAFQAADSGYPPPTDRASCVAYWRGCIERYNAAMLAGDTAAAVAVLRESDGFPAHVHGDGLGCNDALRWLESSTAAPAGEVPMWGQAGRFEILYRGIRVGIEMEGLHTLAMYFCFDGKDCLHSLLPHFSAHAIETQRLFISGSGYWSFFSAVHEAAAGMSVADAVLAVIDASVKRENKGKLLKLREGREGWAA